MINNCYIVYLSQFHETKLPYKWNIHLRENPFYICPYNILYSFNYKMPRGPSKGFNVCPLSSKSESEKK